MSEPDPDTASTAPVEGWADDEPDDALVDDLAAPRRRRWITTVLAAVLLLAGGFTTGVVVQKNLQATAGVPLVTGIVQSVDGNTLRVADSAGAITLVTVPDTAAVGVVGLRGAIAVGTPVAVTGQRWSDGSIVATGVTTRPTR